MIIRMVSLFLVLAFLPAAGHAEHISGVFNTGQSDVEGAQGSTLDIKFHPCLDDVDRTCGTIIALNQDDSAQQVDTMPDGSPIVGFQMIKGLKFVGDNQYKRGKINAVDESIEKDKMTWYGLRVRDNKDGTLTAHGCLGFICPREMVWSEVKAPPSDTDLNANEAQVAAPSN